MFGTKRPRVLSTDQIEREEPAIDTSAALGGIEYYDGILVDNDARFVFSFVRAAIDAGATAANYVELVSAERSDGRWVARLRDVDSGAEFTTTANTIVNAAGPFVDELNEEWNLPTEHRIVYSKGIHLVVRRLTTTDHHKRAGVLRRQSAAVLRDPDGSPFGDRDDRHPRRHAVHRGHRRRHRVPARVRSTPG